MALSTASKNAMLNALGALITHIGLSNAGTELTGGSYARQAVTWASASGGSMAISGTETFSVPAGSTVNRVELCSASSGGTDYGDATVTQEVYGGAGTYTVDSLTLTLSDA